MFPISSLRGSKNVSPYGFALFRLVLGVAVAARAVGTLQEPADVVLVAGGVVLALGWIRRIVAPAIAVALLLLTRDVYLVPALALAAAMPPGEPLSMKRRRTDAFRFPRWLFETGWLLLGAAYLGLGVREYLEGDPSPWVVLQLGFLPLSSFRSLRPWLWLVFLIPIAAGAIPFGVVLLHLFALDYEWIAKSDTAAPRVVLFDGVCVLCDRSMRFLLGEDRDGRILYAPLQGNTAADVLARHANVTGALSSVLYVRALGEESERVYQRSDAAIAILEDLGGLWRLLSMARVVPRPIRDAVYDFVARHRYEWFGQLDECRLPEPAQTKRFLT